MDHDFNALIVEQRMDKKMDSPGIEPGTIHRQLLLIAQRIRRLSKLSQVRNEDHTPRPQAHFPVSQQVLMLNTSEIILAYSL